MSERTLNILWSIALMLIGAATIILSVINIFELSMPDVFVRICGVVDLISLPVLVFTTIKKAKSKK